MSARRTRGTGSILIKGGVYHGKWRVGTTQVMRRIGPVRKVGTSEGLTKTQAEAKLRALITAATPVPPTIPHWEESLSTPAWRESLEALDESARLAALTLGDGPYVYVVRAHTLGIAKIGTSSRMLEGRLRGLAHMNADRLELLEVCTGGVTVEERLRAECVTDHAEWVLADSALWHLLDHLDLRYRTAGLWKRRQREEVA